MTRLAPPASIVIIQAIFLIVGAPVVVLAAGEGEWIVALTGMAMVAFAVLSFGWVDLTSDSLRQVRLGRNRTVSAADITSIKLGNNRSWSFRLWFPVIELRDGQHLKLTTLRSLSASRTSRRAIRIQSRLNGRAQAVNLEHDGFDSPLPVTASSR